MAETAMRRVLSIGGGESSGVAGVAVDLRVFAAHGVHGCFALSAVTAQPDGGSLGVGPGLLRSQIECAAPVHAAKIGLLLSAPQATAILDAFSGAETPLVFDPVHRSSQGVELVQESQWRQLTERLLPHSSLFTPNLDEAALLLGRELQDEDEAIAAAGRELLAMGSSAVLMKGGHREGPAVDLLIDDGGVERFERERFPAEFRGSGCLLSASITALIARGRGVREAVAEAENFVDGALRAAFEAGSASPHVFFEYYGAEGLPSRA